MAPDEKHIINKVCVMNNKNYKSIVTFYRLNAFVPTELL